MSYLQQFRAQAPMKLMSFEDFNNACREVTELLNLQNTLLLNPSIETNNDMLLLSYRTIRDKYTYSCESGKVPDVMPFDAKPLAEGELGGRVKRLMTAISDWFRNVFGTVVVTIDDAKKTLTRMKNLNEEQVEKFNGVINKHEVPVAYKGKFIDCDSAYKTIEKAADKLMKELTKAKEQYMNVNFSRINRADDALEETFKGVKLSAGNWDIDGLLSVDLDDDYSDLNYGSQYNVNQTHYDISYTYGSMLKEFEKCIADNKPALGNSSSKLPIFEPCHFITKWIDQIYRDYAPRSNQEHYFFNRLYSKLILVLNIWCYMARQPTSVLYWMEVTVHQAIQGRS